MEFSIRDFAPIKEADIKLNGLTVIAGDNDTGKSTVGKLLFCIIKAFRRARRSESSQRAGFYVLPLLQQVFGNDNRTGRFVIQPSIDMISNRGWELSLEDNGRGGRMMVGNYSAASDEELCNYKDLLFLETPVVWQLFDTFQGIASEQAKAGRLKESFPINYPYTQFDAYSKLNGSVPSDDSFHELEVQISNTVDGKIVFKGNSPFFERNGEIFSILNTATGIQSFGLLQRLIETGFIRKDHLLILDEPEVHLHPKWQLQYARLIVDMVEKSGVNILLTTHSAVFVEAIEMIGRNILGDRCNVYLSERDGNNDVVMADVTNDLEQIYKSLAQPLARLSIFQEDA